MELTTPRTRLRLFTAADLDNLRRLEGNPEVMRFTGPGRALGPEESAARLAMRLAEVGAEEPFGVWAAELLDGRFVGWFMLKPTGAELHEIGFMMVPEAWGQGLTTEIAERLVRYGLEEHRLPGICAITYAANIGSIRVLEKLGFVEKERIVKKHPTEQIDMETITFERKR